MNKKSSCFTIFILFFFFCFKTNAQSNESDSLTKLLSTNLPDTARVDVLNALSKSYFNTSPDTSVIIAMSSKQLAEKINYKAGLALALKNMGIGYYLPGKYIDAIKTWQQALDVYNLIGDKTGVANMLSNQGAIYFNQGDDAKSLELHLKSLKISEEINDTLRILTSLVNIGAVYLNKPATYDKALDYFRQSYKLSQAINDKYLIGTSTANLGEIYYKMGDDDTALFYLNQSVKAYEGTEDLPYSLNYIGRVNTRKKNFEEAIRNHTEAYEFAKKLNTSLDMTQSLVGLAQAYYAKGDIESAIRAYKQSLDIGIPLKALTEIKDAYEGLSKAYLDKSDFVNAFQYQNLLLAIKDTIYNTNTDKKLGTLQFTFDLEKKESQIDLLSKEQELQQQVIRRQKFVRNSFIAGFAVVLLFAGVFFRQRNRISKEKHRSEELLLNILPEKTAAELKETGKAKTKRFESVSVLFTDFKNFTQASEELTPEELVEEINHCYSEFDRIVSKYGIEKIKTIGDSYMCAGGLPVPNNTHPFDIIAAALEMTLFIEKNKKDRTEKGLPYFELRLGIHTGPVVAGIVGIKKFAYDIWGDTVNTASRMESSGEVGKLNISGATYELVKDKFTCIYRGKVEAKNKGLIDMYFVEGYAAAQ
ncbi:MAG TPA: adenylate/guanylate cyclase domain-containing protein [Chitinophagaceae bacterium]|nr:adenylate/guanylate cyclase domain-containing protein [Chitinophagaceae bacterium]